MALGTQTVHSSLLRIADQYEAGPEERMRRPMAGAPPLDQRHLRPMKRLQLTARFQAAVELLHQVPCLRVWHLEQARQERPSAGVQERPAQAMNAFAAPNVSQAGLACAQDDQLRAA